MFGKCSLAFAVAIALLTQVPIASTQGTCQNPAYLSPCLLTYFDNFGLNGFPYNSTVYSIALNTYLHQNDIAGWNDVRSWTNTLISCVGGQANFEACSDWHTIMNVFNISRQEAITYDADFRVLEYEMGPAFNVLTHNWFCIKQVDQNEGAVVQACYQHFMDQQHQNPNMTCQHIGEYLNCVERPYVTHCGRQVAAVICNIEKIIYNIVTPE